MTHADNPFTRALERYKGIEVEMISNETNDNIRHFPEDVECAIFANAVNGHGKFWKLKDHCKAHGIRQFHSPTGFSPIKNEFENWLQEKGHVVTMVGNHLPEPNGALADAFKRAQSQPEETPKLPKYEAKSMVEQKTPEKMGARNYSSAYMALIAQCVDAGLDAQATIDYVRQQGFDKNVNGTDWTIQKMHTLRYQVKVKGMTAAKVGDSPFSSAKPAKPAEARADVTTRPAALSGRAKDELMGRVFASKLPMERKYQLVEEIHAGLITCENSVMAVREDGKLSLISRNILALEDVPLLMMDKVTAIAVLQSIKDIKAFVDED